MEQQKINTTELTAARCEFESIKSELNEIKRRGMNIKSVPREVYESLNTRMQKLDEWISSLELRTAR